MNPTIKKIATYSALILLPFLVFFQTINYDFVWNDEVLYINDEIFPSGERLSRLDDYASEDTGEMFIPLTKAVWGVTLAIFSPEGEPNPAPLHMLNLFFHILSGIFTYNILFLLLKSNRASLAGALFFMLHPLQAEPVALVSELRGVTSGCFALLSIMLFVMQRKSEGKTASIGYYVGAAASFVAAVLAKPSGVVVPAIIFAIDMLVLRAPFKKAVFTWFWYLLILPVLIKAAGVESAAVLDFEAPFWTRPLIYLFSTAFYTFKTLVPIKLAAIYGYTPQKIIETGFIYWSWILPVGILVLLIRLKNNFLIVSYLILIIAILPVSGMIPFYYQYLSTVADRYVYLGMFGFAAAYAYAISKFRNLRASQILAVGVTTVLIAITFARLPDWQSEYDLWSSNISARPNASPHPYVGRGIIEIERGEYINAVEDFDKAIAIDSTVPGARFNKGNVYFDLGKYKLAIKYYEEELLINPHHDNAAANLALAYDQIGDFETAIEIYSKLLEKSPEVDALVYRGVIYTKTGRFAEAKADFEKASALAPKDEEIKYNLNQIELELSRIDSTKKPEGR